MCVDSGIHYEPDPDDPWAGMYAEILAMVSAMAPSCPWEEAP